MCSISACGGYHYFVIFIVDLGEYVYLLNETRVWNHLMCSKNFGMKKLFWVSAIWSKWQVFWYRKLSYDYWHGNLWKMFDKLRCQEHLNVLMCPNVIIILCWILIGINYLLPRYRYCLELSFKIANTHFNSEPSKFVETILYEL